MMSIQEFLPIISNNLSNYFPELKQYILANYSKVSTIKKGHEHLISNETHFLYLAKGKVKAFLYDQNGHGQLMYIYFSDTMIFQPAGEQFYKKLIILDSATVYYIDKNLLFSFLQSNISYLDRYTQLIASRYGILLQHILISSNEHAKYKVLSFVYTFTERFGISQSNGSILVDQFPSLTDIGALTNVHRTNVSAYINELETLNILHRKNKTLIVTNINALKLILEQTSS